MLDGISKINQEQFEEFGGETQTRISQYEMAFRMQSSVPELMDVTKEPKSVTDLYGPDAQRPARLPATHPRPPHGRARRTVYPSLPPRLGSSWRIAR